MINRSEAIASINLLAGKGIPFVFFTSYNQEKTFLTTLEMMDQSLLRVSFPGLPEVESRHIGAGRFDFRKYPISFRKFSSAYELVVRNIREGNSFLTNLTFETPIETSMSIQNIYWNSQAKYKLLFQDEFVVFSPETFVKISDGKIFSHPMKGTIEASLPNAEEVILTNGKEQAEHATIVDLIRNDLSRYAKKVTVSKYRYIEQLNTNQKSLLQVSSEIMGTLPGNYEKILGDIIFSMLPAGSICGAPKPQTLKIIHEAEEHCRNFYTGICGYFDGKDFDSFVMIRYIEQRDDKMYFKSGGGITSRSDPRTEYQEMIDKVYVPIH